VRRLALAAAAAAIAWTASLVGSAAISGASTKSELQAKALSISNFPTGWSVNNSSRSGGNATKGCLAGIRKPPQHETSATVSYVDGQHPALKEALATGAGTEAAYAKLDHVLASCKQFTAPDDGKPVTFSVGAMSFPQVATQSAAYSVTFRVDGVNAAADLALFRSGSVVGLVEYADIGQPDPDQFQGFVNEAVAKVQGKLTVTPTTL
jgi:hypothetical protein